MYNTRRYIEIFSLKALNPGETKDTKKKNHTRIFYQLNLSKTPQYVKTPSKHIKRNTSSKLHQITQTRSRITLRNAYETTAMQPASRTVDITAVHVLFEAQGQGHKHVKSQ